MSIIDIAIKMQEPAPTQNLAPQSMPPSDEHRQTRSFRESLLAVLGLFFVVMMVALDQTVVATALPTVVAELKGFHLYAWVATSYLLTSVITVPIFGRLGDYFGRKPFVIASVVVFTLASALCGMAGSMLYLVLARALQGVGGGMLVGTAFASVPDLFPEPRVRLRWQLVISSGFGIANAVGPSLGGFLTEYAGWRSVFYVNLPIGMLSLYFLWRYMPLIRHRSHESAVKLDWLGAGLIATSLGALQLFVELLPKGGLTASLALLLATSAAAFVGLYFCEKRATNPVLPIEMFRNRALAALFTMSVLLGFMLFALLFYMPLLLQGGFGLSPKAAGMLITPLVVCITVGSISNARLLTRLPNPSYVMCTGLTLLALSGFGITTLTQTTPRWVVILYMMGSGFGLGFVMPNLTIFSQEAAGRANLGIATAMIQSLRMVGGMLGTALVGTLVNHLYASRVQAMLESAHASQWLPRLDDPQMLINAHAQSQFIAELQAVGQDGRALVDAARLALVSSIHMGQLLSVAVAVLALWQMRRLPPLQLRRRREESAALSGDKAKAAAPETENG
jgi:EmrB/QacA subfamily drug resistance transporter